MEIFFIFKDIMTIVWDRQKKNINFEKFHWIWVENYFFKTI